MQKNRGVFSVWIVVALVLGWCFTASAATDGYYVLSEETYVYQSANGSRWLPEVPGQYQFEYGNDGLVVFNLPWAFRFYGQDYTQLKADTNGNIWFGTAPSQPAFSLPGTGPVISAWNSDLNSYYSGGVFVRNLTDRVVVEWQSETFADAGYQYRNEVEAVLFQDGRIRVSYKHFSPTVTEDSGSGISRGDGTYLSLTSAFGPVTGLAGRTFLFSPDTTPPTVAINAPVAGTHFDATPTLDYTVSDGSVVVKVDGAVVSKVSGEALDTLADGTHTVVVEATDVVGNTAAASVDFIVTTAAPLTVDTVTSPTRQSTLTLTGTKAAADVSIVVDASPAVAGPVTYPTATTWNCQISGLTEGTNSLSVTARDVAGVSSSPIHLQVVRDTVPPGVTVDDPAGPVTSDSYLLTGTRETDTLVAVTVDTAAVAGQVTYPDATSWEVQLSGLEPGINTVTVTATDEAGNTSVAILSVNYELAPNLAVAVSPGSIFSDYVGELTLEINGLSTAGATVEVEQIVDADADGLAEPGEPVVRRFSVTDGTGSANPNLLADTDGAVDGRIVLKLNYFNRLDRYHAAGYYLFRIREQAGESVGALRVDAVSYPQTIDGQVTDGVSPVPGAWVQISDKWSRPVGYAVTDAAGNYHFTLENPGDYLLVPEATGYVARIDNLVPIRVDAAAAVTAPTLVLESGQFAVSGQVYNAATSAGIPGVLVTASGTTYRASVLTASDGSYQLLLPGDDYTITVPVESEPVVAEHGCSQDADPALDLTVSSDLTGIDFTLASPDVLLSGQVLDEFGIGVPGLPVVATNAGGGLAATVTGMDGHYTLALTGAVDWNVQLGTDLSQSLGYVGTSIGPLDTTSATLTGNNLTAYPINAWIEGTVTNESQLPLANLPVTFTNVSVPVELLATTLDDGSYHIGVAAGSWAVRAKTETQGYQPADVQNVSLADAQTVQVDFLATLAQCPDLTVTEVTAPASAQSGQAITVTAKIQNIGAERVEEKYLVYFGLPEKAIKRTAASCPAL